jgi:predicted small integral membrane protein
MNIVKALQDHDYMEKRSLSSRDPFLATGEYLLDNYVLNRNIPEPLRTDIGWQDPSLGRWEVERPGNQNQTFTSICGTRGANLYISRRRKVKDRLVLAVIGGAFLIGPVWLMVLQGGRYTSLITTTSFVIVFGIFMVYYLSEAKDVLASTAAYAAVLVVFVGSNTQNPSG